MKIIILMPVWKRPKLTKKCIEALLKLKPKGIELRIHGVLSMDDSCYLDNFETFNDPRVSFSNANNKLLGVKKTFGLFEAIRLNEDYEYLMEVGSDDFLHPKIFELYEPFIKGRAKFFGMNNTYMYSVAQDKMIWVKEYAGEDLTFGNGRMIHRSVIEKIGCDLWDNYNEGLDTMSGKKMKKAGFRETIIDVGDYSYTLGIKTDVHISPFEFVEQICETREVDTKLMEDFGYEN